MSLTNIFCNSSIPDLIRLVGVTANDLVSADKLMSQVFNEDTKKVKEAIIPLPSVLIDANLWPKSCKLKCCCCALKYNTMPLPMAASVSIVEGKQRFNVKYNYCSIPCALLAIDKIKDTAMRHYRLALFELMLQVFFGESFQLNREAMGKEKEEMTDYGGSLSKKAFRGHINQLTTSLIPKSILAEKPIYLLDTNLAE